MPDDSLRKLKSIQCSRLARGGPVCVCQCTNCKYIDAELLGRCVRPHDRDYRKRDAVG